MAEAFDLRFVRLADDGIVTIQESGIDIRDNVGLERTEELVLHIDEFLELFRSP